MDDFSGALQRLLITFPIFLFSLTIHEAAHAITAKWGGDEYSAYQGRVSLNPIVHMDPIGTVLLPIFGAFTGIPLIGWAKPVPVIEENFRRGPAYGVVVALAGPFSNLLIALFTTALYMLYLTFAYTLSPTGLPSDEMVGQLVLYMVVINLALMTFNLIPIPPLDGSHVLWHWFVKHQPQLHDAFFAIRQYGFFLLLLLLGAGIIGGLFATIVFPLLSFLLRLAAFPVNAFL